MLKEVDQDEPAGDGEQKGVRLAAAMPMSLDQIVTDLLLRREAEPSLTAEELCQAHRDLAQHAELLEAVKQGIRDLQAAAAWLGAGAAGTNGPSPHSPGRTGPYAPRDEVLASLAPAQRPVELGRLGSYRVLRLLGSGGMGVVFQAEDPELKRLVALKIMRPGLAASSIFRERFLPEVRAMAAVKHDHIVTVYQVGQHDGVLFLAMEFLEGETLEQRLKYYQGTLPLAQVLRIGREIAAGPRVGPSMDKA
jgi:hypothetical protein